MQAGMEKIIANFHSKQMSMKNVIVCYERTIAPKCF